MHRQGFDLHATPPNLDMMPSHLPAEEYDIDPDYGGIITELLRLG